MAKFPTDDWLRALVQKLNTDEHYAQVARNWEGDMLFVIEPGGQHGTETRWYLDLWHGKCRDAYTLNPDSPQGETPEATFTLRAPYDNYVHLLKGEIEPLQALWTRKIGVQGNMAALMRSVPTVLDFVRCAREVTDSYL